MTKAERMMIAARHLEAARPAEIDGTPDHRRPGLAVIEARSSRPAESENRVGSVATVGQAGAYTLPGTTGVTNTGGMAERAVRRIGRNGADPAPRVESLAETCEFRLFRPCRDAERLRLSEFPSIFKWNLIRGIETGFDGSDETDDMDPHLEGGGLDSECMGDEAGYGLAYHRAFL